MDSFKDRIVWMKIGVDLWMRRDEEWGIFFHERGRWTRSQEEDELGKGTGRGINVGEKFEETRMSRVYTDKNGKDQSLDFFIYFPFLIGSKLVSDTIHWFMLQIVIKARRGNFDWVQRVEGRRVVATPSSYQFEC